MAGNSDIVSQGGHIVMENKAQTFSEIAVRDLEKGGDSLGFDINPLLVTDVLNSGPRTLIIQRLEPELGAPGGQWLNNPAHVVADDAEAGDPGVLLHRPPQRVLRVLGHRIRLIKNDDFVRRARVSSVCTGKPPQRGAR